MISACFSQKCWFRPDSGQIFGRAKSSMGELSDYKINSGFGRNLNCGWIFVYYKSGFGRTLIVVKNFLWNMFLYSTKSPPVQTQHLHDQHCELVQLMKGCLNNTIAFSCLDKQIFGKKNVGIINNIRLCIQSLF